MNNTLSTPEFWIDRILNEPIGEAGRLLQQRLDEQQRQSGRTQP